MVGREKERIMINLPFDICLEKQLIKKEAEECWETLMEYASERCLEREFAYREFLENLHRLARENF